METTVNDRRFPFSFPDEQHIRSLFTEHVQDVLLLLGMRHWIDVYKRVCFSDNRSGRTCLVQVVPSNEEHLLRIIAEVHEKFRTTTREGGTLSYG